MTNHDKPEKIHIGTSGWHYKHWKDVFYPQSLPSGNYLKYYSQYFKTVEINNSFYKHPDESVVEKWRNETPEDFIFAYKANRYITHMKKMKDPEAPLEKLRNNLAVPGEKVKVVLFQLPPNFRSNPQRLEEFIKHLPHGYRYSFEFRDKSWFNDKIFDILKKHGVSFCIYDMGGDVTPFEITADFIYIRLHGTGTPYNGNYEDRMLQEWGEKISEWRKQGKEVFCYFNNDIGGFAVKNAMKLNEILGVETGQKIHA
jgi:uncharacterized protein YecE (DUF72 family)